MDKISRILRKPSFSTQNIANSANYEMLTTIDCREYKTCNLLCARKRLINRSNIDRLKLPHEHIDSREPYISQPYLSLIVHIYTLSDRAEAE